MGAPRIEVLQRDDGIVSVDCPYHPRMIAHAKTIGGRFISGRDLWYFKAESEDRVRLMLRLIYGWDGPPSPEPRWVAIRYRLDGTEGAELWLGGKHVAERRFPGSMPVLGLSVTVVSGGFETVGGSRARPALGGAGTVVQIEDVAESLARDLVMALPDQCWIVGEEEVPDAARAAKTTDAEVLLARALPYLAALNEGRSLANPWPVLVVDVLGGDVVLRELLYQCKVALGRLEGGK